MSQEDTFMTKRLYVGNLPYSMTSDELKTAFSSCGNVVSARVIMDRETHRSKGFGFVEFTNDEEGKRALDTMNGKDVAGRKLKVTEANSQQDRPVGGNRFGGPRVGGFRK